MFRLAKDARVLDMLANDPTIFPTISPPDSIEPFTFGVLFEPETADLFRAYHNGSDDADMSATVATLFCWSSHRLWEMHVFAKPEARRGTAVRFGHETMADMFINQGAEQIWAQVPVWNKPTLLYARRVGGVPSGFADNPILKCKVELFVLTRSRWETLPPKYGVKNLTKSEVMPSV